MIISRISFVVAVEMMSLIDVNLSELFMQLSEHMVTTQTKSQHKFPYADIIGTVIFFARWSRSVSSDYEAGWTNPGRVKRYYSSPEHPDRLWSLPIVLFRWRSWLKNCATSRKFAGSIPDGVTRIFH